jgi:hypothetical protein
MNNTKKRTLSLVAVLLAATLVVGVGSFAATTTTKTAFAASNNSGNTVTAQINGQKATQSGFDNVQEQEDQNTICTHPGENATCVQEGAAAVVTPTQAPVKKTCEQCFTSLLTDKQIKFVVDVFGDVGTLARLCEALQNTAITEVSLQEALSDAGVSDTTANELIACLLKAGVVFFSD